MSEICTLGHGPAIQGLELEKFHQWKFSRKTFASRSFFGCGQWFLSGKTTLGSYQLKHSGQMFCRDIAVWAVTAANLHRRKFSKVTLEPCRAWVPRTVPCPFSMARCISLMKRSLFGVFWELSRPLTCLLIFLCILTQPAMQLLISTQGMICHWSHGALSGFFFLSENSGWHKSCHFTTNILVLVLCSYFIFSLIAHFQISCFSPRSNFIVVDIQQ